MIISASRRTDIPAFYSDWFMNRLREGFVYVRNAFNQSQISEITLRPDLIECIVFWTKNPNNIFKKLKEIDSLGYQYYFQFTLTAYGREIEKNLPDKDTIIHFFKKLSDTIGPEKVIWRYDPIVITEDITDKSHIDWFDRLSGELRGYTSKCITSFIDMYKKCERNMASLHVVNMDNAEKLSLLKHLKEIAHVHGMKLETCAEEMEASETGILPAKCIDDTLVARLIGEDIRVKKDPSQRKRCGCVQSIDIGAYNTCRHHCLYCYANHNFHTVERNKDRHEVHSPLLIGNVNGTEVISQRDIKPYRKGQLNLLQKNAPFHEIL
jgi:hypothetical protein